MAFKGHSRQGYCVITEKTGADGSITETLGAGVITSNPIDFKGALKRSNVDLYAGDDREMSESGAEGGAVDIVLSDLPLKDEAALCGHTLATDGGVQVNAGDEAPYVRYAAIGVGKRRGGGTFYRVACYYKVQFGDLSDEYHTKEETPKFITPSLSGNIFKNCLGKIAEKNDYATFDLALAALKKFVNVKEGT